MPGRHATVNPETLGHDHIAVQFRDGKEPHCRTCGLTSDGRTPVSRLHPPVTRRTGPGVGRGPAAAPGQAQPPRGAAGVSRPQPTATEFARFGTRVHGVSEADGDDVA